MSKYKKNKKTFITGADVRNAKMRSLSALNRDKFYGDTDEKIFVKRNRLYEKILFNINDEEYYNNCYTLYKLKPGISFIKRLFNHDRSDIAVPYLKLNLPETYWNDTEMFYVYNDWNNYGALTVIRNKKDFNLFNAFDRVEREQYMRQVKDIEPFIVIRGETMITVDRYEKCKENLGKDIGDGIVQRYIRCRGRNRNLDKLGKTENDKKTKNKKAMNIDLESVDYFPESLSKNLEITENNRSTTKPCVVRLEYKTCYNRDKGGNVAYCLSNKLSVEDSIRPATKEIFEKYTQLTTLNTIDENSFNIYIMSGEAVGPYEFYANQICKYVQKWFGVLFKTIVVDFMKDERSIIYFLGVKAFDLLKEPIVDPKAMPTALIKKDNYKKFYKTWTCRLCQLPYPRNKITKTVTFKLLYKLKENLKKRGFNYFEHINNNIYSESQTCRVCDLCYALLVTEQELMEMQRTIALCNNIEIQSEETLNEGNKTPEGLVKAPQKYKTLTQWRIMFYFLKFYFMDYEKFPFEDGSQLPDNATPQEKKKGKTNYKLYISIFNQKIGIPIFTEMKQFLSQTEVELNTSKIFYFFSSESSAVKQILRNEEVDFRIVLNDKYNEPLAQCKTCCFNNYEDSFKDKPMTTKKILNFFSDYIQHFKCQMYLGLINDGIVQTENLPMYCHKLPNPIYLTELNYYSYHTLPNDWYELYLPPDTNVEDDNAINNYEIEKKIDDIILTLEGKEKKKKMQSDDEVYDPYDLLVQVQNKNDIINKIESIPIVLDKNFLEMKREEKKERPQTSKLRARFHFENKNNYVPGKKSTTGLFYVDEEIRQKRMKEEEERKKMMKMKEEEIKKKEEERNDVIKNGNNDKFDELLNNMDKEFKDIIN